MKEADAASAAWLGHDRHTRKPVRRFAGWRWPLAKALDLRSFNVASRRARSAGFIHKYPCGVPWNRTATSTKMLPHVDQGKLPVGASIILDVSNPRVQREVLSHLLVREQINGIEPRAPGFGFRKLEEALPSALPRTEGSTATLSIRNPSSSTVRTITPT